VVVDIVLPAVLGLILVGKAGIEAYDKKINEGNSSLSEDWHLPAATKG
jgi:hypothetical protein